MGGEHNGLQYSFHFCSPILSVKCKILVSKVCIHLPCVCWVGVWQWWDRVQCPLTTRSAASPWSSSRHRQDPRRTATDGETRPACHGGDGPVPGVHGSALLGGSCDFRRSRDRLVGTLKIKSQWRKNNVGRSDEITLCDYCSYINLFSTKDFWLQRVICHLSINSSKITY